MRNKRERQQQVPDTIGQNKPCHSRSEFPKKKPKFQAERGKEGGKEVLFTFEGESQKENKALKAAPHTQPSSLSGSKSNPQSQIRQEKRGKRRNPATFGKPHPRLQQNLGKRKLGWSLPSPQLGSHRGGGVLEDLNREKREKNNNNNEIWDTPCPWREAYPKENRELMSDAPSSILPAADFRV